MKIFRKVRSLFRREKIDTEMTEEMRTHLDLQAERNVAAGMNPEEARYAAQRQFGNIANIQERARDIRIWRWLGEWLGDLRFALRSLLKHRLYAVSAGLILALGVGVSTASFSVFNVLVLQPLQYREAERLVEIRSLHPKQGISGVAPATFRDLAADHTSFAALAAQYYYYVNLTGGDAATQLTSADVTADYFDLFGVNPLLGRGLMAGDFAPGATPVVVLGRTTWRNLFNENAAITGRQIMLDDVSYTVVGVMPDSFKDPAETAQLWRPMQPGLDRWSDRDSRYFVVFGRLLPGITQRAANVELATRFERLRNVYPKSYDDWTLQVDELRDLVIGDYEKGLLVILGAAGCLMFITGANIAGLSTARALARRREFAIRLALGSSRGRLLRLILTENLLLAAVGCGGGIFLAHFGLRVLLVELPAGWLPRADEIAVDAPVLLAGIGLALVVGIASGFIAGLASARGDGNEALKDSARASPGHRVRRLREGLIVSEIALALALLCGAGLLGRSFFGLLHKRAGLDATRVLSLNVSLPAKRFDRPAKCWDYFSRVQSEIASVPGVEAVGLTHTSPFRWGISAPFVPEAKGTTAHDPTPSPAFDDSVNVDYFRAMGIPLLAGRSFAASDDYRAHSIAILSQKAARVYFGAEDPLGHFITTDDGRAERLEIVGVVGDVRRTGLAADVPLQVYRPFAQRTPPFATIMVRTALSPATLANTVQAALRRIEPDVPVTEIATMDTFVKRSVAQPRLYLTLFGLFAGLAVVLAAVGIYGLIRYGVEQRQREFGIRTALGASPAAMLALVLREGAALIGLGVSIGLGISLAGSRLLQSMVYDVSPRDPLIFLAVTVGLAAIALMACWLPARRATKVNPMVALRAE